MGPPGNLQTTIPSPASLFSGKGLNICARHKATSLTHGPQTAPGALRATEVVEGWQLQRRETSAPQHPKQTPRDSVRWSLRIEEGIPNSLASPKGPRDGGSRLASSQRGRQRGTHRRPPGVLTAQQPPPPLQSAAQHLPPLLVTRQKVPLGQAGGQPSQKQQHALTWSGSAPGAG